jgi:hypothetical protein
MTRVLIGLVSAVVVAFFLIPIGTFWVDETWVYGVSDLRQIWTSANYEGQRFGKNGEFVLGEITSRQTESLTAFEYLRAKRAKAVHGRYIEEKEIR